MRKLLAIVILCLWLATLLGCQLIPWHPFGSPLTREQTAQQNVLKAKESAGNGLVEEVSKAAFAVDAAIAGNPNALPVAQQHVRVAKNLATQIFGTPTVVNEEGWKSLIDRQTSLDAKIRDAANQENSKRVSQIAKLSDDLASRDAKLEVAEKKAMEYAKEKEAIADRFLKFIWIIGGLFALYFLGQILQFLAHFNPAFESAANVVNSIVSPALHSAASKARKALNKATA
jgi:hypothetical protein